MRLIYFILVVTTINVVNAQVAGISASKLNSVCVDVIDDKKLEFEPGFYHTTTNTYWDNKSNLQNEFEQDSTRHISTMFMRVSYGLFNKIEVGLLVPVDISAVDVGMKYVILQNKNIGYALIAGVNYPLGNTIGIKNRHTIINTAQAGIGGVSTYNFNTTLSIDFNVGYGKYFGQNNIDYLTYISADAGYYLFSHQLQLVAGLGYKNFQHFNNLDNQQLLTFFPGITIETGKKYIIVLTSPIDVYGKNIIRTTNFGFALTIIID